MGCARAIVSTGASVLREERLAARRLQGVIAIPGMTIIPGAGSLTVIVVAECPR